MYLLILGIVLLALKWLQIVPVAEWSWLWVLSPFAAAALWWALADATGYTARKVAEKEKEEARARARKRKQAMEQ
ncbi:MAG: TIGR04438 family Trp-rich protein [Burkholderiaceae bacterium]|jgi:small Trp-rich protein|nr:TIGR04438 family Trp-rich protein [Burkholderiaceae bacterium]